MDSQPDGGKTAGAGPRPREPANTVQGEMLTKIMHLYAAHFDLDKVLEGYRGDHHTLVGRRYAARMMISSAPVYRERLEITLWKKTGTRKVKATLVRSGGPAIVAAPREAAGSAVRGWIGGAGRGGGAARYARRLKKER